MIPRREFARQGGTGSMAARAAAGSGKQMNVLFIIADQHNASCMHYEGHPQAITPNLDRLAASGVKFTLDIASTIPALCGLPVTDATDGHDITSLPRRRPTGTRSRSHRERSSKVTLGSVAIRALSAGDVRRGRRRTIQHGERPRTRRAICTPMPRTRRRSTTAAACSSNGSSDTRATAPSCRIRFLFHRRNGTRRTAPRATRRVLCCEKRGGVNYI